jgi:hypothetical protein
VTGFGERCIEPLGSLKLDDCFDQLSDYNRDR